MRISDWSSDVCSSDLRAVADRSRKLLRRGLRRRLVPYGEQCGHPSTEQSVVGSGNGVRRRNSGSNGNSTCEPSASVRKNGPARSEERRGGREWFSACRTRGSPSQSNKKMTPVHTLKKEN